MDTGAKPGDVNAAGQSPGPPDARREPAAEGDPILQALGEQAREFRRMAEALPVPIAEVAPAGRILYVNRAARDRLGLRRRDLAAGVSVHELMTSPSSRRTASRIAERLTGRELTPVEYEVRTLGGDLRIMEVAASNVADADGRIVGMRSCLFDVTDRRRAEADLDGERRFLEGLLENNPLGIVVYDRAGKPVRFNQAATDLLGEPPSDDWSALEDPVLRARGVVQVLRRAFEGHAVQVVEQWHEPSETSPAVPDRRVRLRSTVFPLPDGEGRIANVVAVHQDVTSRYRAEQEARRAHRRVMSAREDERKRLAAELHDSVGQGLVAARLAAQRALSGMPPDADGQARGALDSAMEILSGLVREVRQISYGLYPATLESMGLAVSLEQLVRFGESGGLRASFACDEALRGARFERDREIALFRIAQEAVNNVMRHSRAGHLEMRLERSEGRLRLSVSDDGVGFDAGDASLAGLGLNTMRDRATAAAGRLDVRSQAGHTCITAEIPIQGS